MNKVILIGRLTKDVELKYTSSNIAIANFTLAVKRDYKNKNGEYESDFINCVSYKTTAEFINKYTSKGSLLGIVGNIQIRSYDAQDGSKKYITEIIVDKVELLSKTENKIEEKSVEKNIPAEKEETDPFTQFSLDNPISDEDLPF